MYGDCCENDKNAKNDALEPLEASKTCSRRRIRFRLAWYDDTACRGWGRSSSRSLPPFSLCSSSSFTQTQLHQPHTNHQLHTSTNMSLSYLPPVKPSAIALGTVFNHAASLAILGPLFGDTYRRAQSANSAEEFIKSKEAASAGAAWGTSLVGSAIQSYGVGALINATGTLSYKGAAYLGALIFFASSAPSVSFSHHMNYHVRHQTNINFAVRLSGHHREASSRHRRRWRPCTHLRDRRPFPLHDLVGNSHQPT